jgi:hypothetical protein
MTKLLLNIQPFLPRTLARYSPLPTFLSNQSLLPYALQSPSLLKHIVLFLSDITTIMMNTTLNQHRSASLTVFTDLHRFRPVIGLSPNPLPPRHLHLPQRQSPRSNNTRQIPLVRSYFRSQGREAGTAT